MSRRSVTALPPRSVAALLGVAFLAVCAAPAGAATFYVDDDATASGDCLSPASACRTVEEATVLTRNDKSPGADTVHVAAGTYIEDLYLYESPPGPEGYAGLTIIGAGSSGTNATRILAPPTPDPFSSNTIIYFSGPTDSTTAGEDATFRLQDLSVESGSEARGGVYISSSIMEMTNVRVEVSCGCIGVQTRGTLASFDHVVVDAPDPGDATGGTALIFEGASSSNGQLPRLAVVDSVLTGSDTEYPNGGGSALIGNAFGTTGTAEIERSRLSSGAGTGTAVLWEMTPAIESSLIRGEEVGLMLQDCTGDGRISGSTLHATKALWLYNCNPGADTWLDNSLAIGTLDSTADLSGRKNTLRCHNSEVELLVRDEAQHLTQCGAATGNLGVNPGATFVDHQAGDYRLRACVSAIDSGPPGAYAADALDAAGGARLVDGDLDGLTVADRGAFEHVPPAGARPCRELGTGGSPPAVTDLLAPVASRLSVEPVAFRAARSGRPLAARRGARLSFRLQESAAVGIGIERRLRGQRARRRFRRLPGSVTVTGRIGANRLRLSGRWRGRALRPGPYRLRLVATDAAGNRSVPRRVGFRILAPRARR